MITLSGNKIKVLGHKAFYSLITIDFINLGNNLIKQLDADTFAIENTNHSHHGPLRISFKINRITNISDFAFRGLERPVTLDISFNNMTQLSSSTFKNLLSHSETKINLKGIYCFEIDFSVLNLIKLMKFFVFSI